MDPHNMAFRYRIFPTEEQKHQIAVNVGCARYVWNRILADYNEQYKLHGKSPNIQKYYQPLISVWKKEEETAWLKEADSAALIYSCRMLDQAWKNFYRNPSHFGKPKFKKKSHRQSYRIQTNAGNGKVDTNTMTIRLCKLGAVALNYHRPMQGTPVAATITKTPSDAYFVTITVKDVYTDPMPEPDRMTGVDIGVRNLITDADGNVWPNPRALKKYQKQLRHAQHILSKKKKGSANYEKQRIKVAKIHEHIANVRRDAVQNATHDIVRDNSIIFAETLGTKDMMQDHYMADAITDSTFAEILRELEYKSAWNDRLFMQIDRYYPSTMTCNDCGFIDRTVSQRMPRVWTCPDCDSTHPRKYNAAKNILDQGLLALANPNAAA